MRSLRNVDKRQTVFQHLSQSSIDIAVLTETWLDTRQCPPEFATIQSPPSSSEGVLIALR